MNLISGFGIAAAIHGVQRFAVDAACGISRGWREVKSCWAGTDSFTLRVLGVTPSMQVRNALRCAAFEGGWEVVFTSSLEDARQVLTTSPVDAVICGHDDVENDWHSLCNECQERRVCFHLAARAPSDGLFLTVVSAGGTSVPGKPLTSGQTVSAVHCGWPAPLAGAADEMDRQSARIGRPMRTSKC